MEKLDENQQMKQVLPRLRRMVERKAWGEIQNFGMQEVPEMRDFFEAVQREQQKQIRSEIDGIKELLAETTATLERADAPENVDAILKKLTEAKSDNNYSYEHRSAELQKLRQNISYARQTVCYWQDFLNHAQSGNASQERSALSNVLGSLSEYQVVPRSRVLGMMNGIKDGNEANQATPKMTFDSIAKKFRSDSDADSALKAMKGMSDPNNAGYALRQEVTKIKRLSENLSSMSVEEVVAHVQSNSDSDFKLMYDKLAISKIAQASSVVEPKEIMSVNRYLRLTADAAIKAENWKDAQWRLKMYSGDRRGDQYVDDLGTISQYLKGMEFEKVGMWKQAVAAYQAAIDSPYKEFPIEKVLLRLKEVQAKESKANDAK